MATKAQIAANRRNAQKSTGPRTAEGVDRCKFNATTHSLCATIPLTQDERNGGQADEFNKLRTDLQGEWQPASPSEDILVYKMAASFFASNRAQAHLAEALDGGNFKQVSLMLRYHTTNDRAFSKHLNELRKLQKDRPIQEIGSVVRRDKPA